ncbi:hypothetical protein PFISCL1PPCAC_6978, partial [Pristionchus fissidentatus]
DRSSIIYSLIDKTGLFSLHPTNGLLSIQHPEFVDASSFGDSLNLTARVVDGSGNTQQATIVVHVKNGLSTERKLVFEQDSYNLTVFPGESGLGQLRLQSTPSRGVNFAISEGFHEDVIQVHNRTGELRYTGEIEKENQEFDLKILASSANSIAVVPVHILIRGIGSYVPKFRKKENIVAIMRDLPVDSLVHEFSAIDRDVDASLRFRILTTTAQDMIGTPLQDPDFSRLFRLESKDVAGRLLLDEDISALEVLSLRVEVEVRDENHPEEIPDRATLLILVQALKSSRPEIPLLQANRVPELISLPANLEVGSYVYTVTAKPSIADGLRSAFWYELNDGKQFFEINSNTGVIHTIASLRNEKELHAQIVISHLNTSTSVQVPLRIRTISVLDKAPKFTNSFYELAVDEATPPGTKILTVSSSDEDVDDSIHYELEGKDAEQFEINEKGEIYLRTELDREMKKSIHLFAKAVDSTGRFDVAPVTLTIVDSNDSEPFFVVRNLVATVMEDAPIGSFVVRAQATDPDSSSDLHYEIRVPNETSMLSKLIRVDENGTVTTAAPLAGLEGTFIFEVIVNDGKHTVSAEVNMEITHNFDCHPMFDLETERGGNFVFEIQENAPMNFALGQVKAEPIDEKCGLEFVLWDAEKKEFVHETSDLSMDSKTGELRTNRVFDAERDAARIPVVLGLRAQKHTAKMGAELRVIDLNDNQLRFAVKEMHFKIPENSPNFTRIGAVEAHDKDMVDEIFYRLDEPYDLFAVNAQTGEIALIGEIDREKIDKHTFTIVASNSNSASSIHTDDIEVTVHVEDVNDNPPVFLIEDQSILLNDNTIAGSVLMRVRADDPDIVKDGEVGVFYRIAATSFEYRRMSNPVENVFSVHEETGDIRLEKSVKDFTGGRFNILLAASDRNDSKGHESFATLKATVHSPSDIVVAQVAGSPLRMTRKVLKEITGKLSSATDSDAHVSSVDFATEAGLTIKDASSISLVFTGRDSGEPIPAEKMVAKMDRLRMEGVKNLPVVMADTRHLTPSHEHEETIAFVSTLAPVFLVLLFFFTLLAIVIFIFSVMVCVYRRRYNSLKKRKEDLLAIKNSQKTPELPNSGTMLAIKASSDRNPSSTISTPSIVDSYYKNGNYDVQEARMNVVNPEDD